MGDGRGNGTVVPASAGGYSLTGPPCLRGADTADFARHERKHPWPSRHGLAARPITLRGITGWDGPSGCTLGKGV